jgi:hypothetical protein
METSDARTLSSGTPQEEVYADYANSMKSLANQARKEYISTGDIKYSSEAKAKYLNEFNSLNSKLNVALMNAPKERRAQVIANTEIKAKKESFPPELVAFVGFLCSFGGKWFGGYARGNDTKGNPRNYCLESKNNILKQAEGLRGVDFIHSSYNQLEIPSNSIIYCDPPYAGTTKYKDGFDHNKFWNWCREKSKEGHKVFISEYNAPDDFECIWEMEVNSSLTKDTGSKKATEKLFKYKGGN